jgi:hypothetical protein
VVEVTRWGRRMGVGVGVRRWKRRFDGRSLI